MGTKHVSLTTLRVIKKLFNAVERYTGYRWKFSSHVYNSYSHRSGHAFDMVPDIAKSAQKYYAHNYGSDPILHSRHQLIRRLQRLARDKDLRKMIRDYGNDVTFVIAIEQNHLHCGLYLNRDQPDLWYPNNIRVWKWKDKNPLSFKYKDSRERQNVFVS